MIGDLLVLYNDIDKMEIFVVKCKVFSVRFLNLRDLVFGNENLKKKFDFCGCFLVYYKLWLEFNLNKNNFLKC